MNDLYAEALVVFRDLLEQARASIDPEPTAMTLATLGTDGRLAARTVLLKAHDERGFVFYTNTRSRKGRELGGHGQAALLFHWKHLRQGIQVRIEGRVEPVSDNEADRYFASRPRPSQLGAWASEQSETLESRELFERLSQPHLNDPQLPERRRQGDRWALRLLGAGLLGGGATLAAGAASLSAPAAWPAWLMLAAGLYLIVRQ